MNSDPSSRQHLFTLRLWREEDNEGRTIWRGRIHHTDTGNIRYFRGWPALIPLLLAMLRQPQSTIEAPPDSEPDQD